MSNIRNFIRFKIWLLAPALCIFYLIILGISALVGDNNFLDYAGISALITLGGFAAVAILYGLYKTGQSIIEIFKNK